MKDLLRCKLLITVKFLSCILEHQLHEVYPQCILCPEVLGSDYPSKWSWSLESLELSLIQLLDWRAGKLDRHGGGPIGFGGGLVVVAVVVVVVVVAVVVVVVVVAVMVVTVVLLVVLLVVVVVVVVAMRLGGSLPDCRVYIEFICDQ